MRSTFAIILLTICKLAFASSETLFHEDFEDGHINGWKTYQNWTLDSLQTVTGNYSLRHFVFGKGGESYATHAIAPIDLNAGELSWKVTLSNGDWSPAKGEAFGFWLCADSADLTKASGYVAGVNLITDDNRLTLVRFENGKPVGEILRTGLTWNEGKTVLMQISHSPEGLWHFSYRDKRQTGWSDNYEADEDTPSMTMQALGVSFRFTAAHGGQLWLDDVDVGFKNTPPFIREVSASAQKEIRVLFSEKMSNTAYKAEDYQLADAQGNTVSLSGIENDASNPAAVRLEIANSVFYGLKLTVRSVYDEQGSAMKDTTVAFQYAPPPQPGDVVFTEVMADPTPSRGLPEAEFVELFNRTDYPCLLKNWTMQVNGVEKKLPDLSMQPQSFLLLTGTNNASLFQDYGAVYEITGLSLRNNGFSLTLLTEDGVCSDSLMYLADFFDNEKKDGGWSLERIDPNRLCGSAGNWMASVSPEGGTPGSANPETQVNPDNSLPEVVGVRAESDSLLTIWFSEPIAILPEVSISGNYSQPDSSRYVARNNHMEVFFPAGTFTEGKSYTLRLSAFADECGNQTDAGEQVFSYRFLQPGDIMLSEVLFNPLPEGVDFVELYNPGPDDLDISGIMLATRNDTMGLKQLSSVSEKPYMLATGAYVALTVSPDAVKNQYFTECPECFVKMSVFPSLPDDAGSVVILNRRMEVLEEFRYNHKMQHPLVNNESGVSLERTSFLQDVNLPGNWQSAAATKGFATPGYENSAAKMTQSPADWMNLKPKIFSPNNDGYNDRLLIHLVPGESGWVASIRIFDTTGHEIRRLASNELLAADNQLEWDGRKDNHQLAALGIYIVDVEAFNPNGQTKIFRKTCVLTDRLH